MKTNFYAICASGENAEDGFYKVKAENFGEEFILADKTKMLEVKSYIHNAIDIINRYPNIIFRRSTLDEGVVDWVTHTPVAFVLEVNSHLPRPKISFDKEVRKFGSVESINDECDNAFENEPKNSREYCKNALKNEVQSESVAGAGVQNQTKDEAQRLVDEAKNNSTTLKTPKTTKITGEALKDRLITKAYKDSEHLRAIFKKVKVDTTIYFEDEAGEIVSLWYERRDEAEQSGAIKALMMSKKAFVVADLCESKKPLIRFCKGFKSEWLDENGEPIKDYR